MLLAQVPLFKIVQLCLKWSYNPVDLPIVRYDVVRDPVSGYAIGQAGKQATRVIMARIP